MDDSYKLFYKQLLDFGPGVGYQEGKEKYMREKRQEEERKRRKRKVATGTETRARPLQLAAHRIQRSNHT